jgi:hypothetical protein
MNIDNLKNNSSNECNIKNQFKRKKKYIYIYKSIQDKDLLEEKKVA